MSERFTPEELAMIVATPRFDDHERSCPDIIRRLAQQALDAERALHPVSDATPDLAAAVDAVADALNGWDLGEAPRPDTHRHWATIVAALHPVSDATPDLAAALNWLAWALPVALRESVLRRGNADEARWIGVGGDGMDADHVLAGTLMVTLRALASEPVPGGETPG